MNGNVQNPGQRPIESLTHSSLTHMFQNENTATEVEPFRKDHNQEPKNPSFCQSV